VSERADRTIERSEMGARVVKGPKYMSAVEVESFLEYLERTDPSPQCPEHIVELEEEVRACIKAAFGKGRWHTTIMEEDGKYIVHVSTVDYTKRYSDLLRVKFPGLLSKVIFVQREWVELH
jgi:hypothetical protein